ncbi:hypothetical protein ACWEQL_15055 [Kitasatospora sp. NPDC004240]
MGGARHTEQDARRTGRTRNARRWSAAALTLLVAGTTLGCSGDDGSGKAAPAVDPDSTVVRTDTEPLQRRFLAIGQFSDPHWLFYYPQFPSGRELIPSPDRPVRLVGIAHLPTGTAAAITTDPAYHFEPARPPATPAASPSGHDPGGDTPGPLRPPPPLAGSLPGDTRWLTSPEYDRSVTKSQYWGRFFLDPATDSIYFDTISPKIVDGSDKTATPSTESTG